MFSYVVCKLTSAFPQTEEHPKKNTSPQPELPQIEDSPKNLQRHFLPGKKKIIVDIIIFLFIYLFYAIYLSKLNWDRICHSLVCVRALIMCKSTSGE